MFRKLIPAFLLLALLGTAKATTFLTLQSTYLGDGWFQYQMNVMNDPFFTMVDIGGFEVSFTNEIDQSTSSTNYAYNGSDGSYAGWALTNWPPTGRPYTETFLLRSSETSWKLQTDNPNPSGPGAIIDGGLSWNEAIAPSELNGGLFFAGMACLVPCSPEEADGSPTNYTYVLKLVPDVALNGLIQTNGNVFGVDFTWNYDSTFLLQGSTDLNDWTNIAYIWSYPPETVWTTNTPLNNYGQFFRVELVADGYSTNLPPLASALATTPRIKSAVSPASPAVTGSKFVNGRILVNVAKQSGQTVSVEALDSHGTVCGTQSVVVQGTSSTVSFDATKLPNPAFFKVVQ